MELFESLATPDWLRSGKDLDSLETTLSEMLRSWLRDEDALFAELATRLV